LKASDIKLKISLLFPTKYNTQATLEDLNVINYLHTASAGIQYYAT